MNFITPNSVAELNISVTGTATGLYSLMETAGTVVQLEKYYGSRGANSIVIIPEDGDIRYLWGADPTAAIGIPVSSGVKVHIPVTDISDFRLIAQSGTVSCQVALYHEDAGTIPTN